MKFCSGSCRERHYKENPPPPFVAGVEKPCEICSKMFLKKKNNQRYCSTGCYIKAWPINNREKSAKRSRDRRAAKPDWYRDKEPGYYRNYRTGQLEKRPWRYVFQSRRSDAKNKGMEFSLTDEWCAARWTNACELTKIPFEKNPSGAQGPHPFACSLDRIDSSKGYTPDNSRFILWGCNAMKGVGTDADMYRIAAVLMASISRKG